MKAVIQRVTSASVVIDKKTHAEIEKGYLILLGVKQGDTQKDLKWLAKKIAKLRVMSDKKDKMNLSLNKVNGEALIVSQFTLYGDCSKGNRPSFIKAAEPEIAKKLYEQFITELKKYVKVVKSGKFGAYMDVNLINDGPVTIIIES